jgi:hypothetical protein
MATIKTSFGSGGSNLTPGGASATPSLATALRDVADDLADLKAKHNGAMAKLDADGGVTDTNYAALWNVGTLKTIKG